LLIRKKKLRVSAARRPLGAADDMDYEEMSEPNMKLSRALLIVLVLHVVAVAGIIAFNTLKSRQGAIPRPTASSAPTSVQPAESVVAKSPSAAPLVPPQTKATPAVGKAPGNIEQVKAALPVAGVPAEAGKFYVVVKGDNPVAIAKKLKVSESDLLAVNHIDDPRKLQIGQKLIVPAAKKTKAKADGN